MSVLSILFKGTPGDDHVYQCEFDGSGWSTPQVIPQIVTGAHPMWVRYYDQTIFTAWRDVSTPHNVHAARYDGPNAWNWLGLVPGAFTGAAPGGAYMSTPFANLLLGWKSDGADNALHYAIFDSLHWGAAGIVAGAYSSHGPALATFENKVHLVWKGIPGDHNVFHATYDGTNWSAPQQIPGITSTSQPALTTYAGRLILAFKGKEGDPAIYWSALASGTQPWLPPIRISTFETGTGPAILEFAGRLHLVWKGVGDDYSVFIANFDGAFWSGQYTIPGVSSSSTPTLAEYDPAF